MAVRTPVVMINGQLQNMPTGDTLNVPQAGGDIMNLTNDEVGTVVCGTPVYCDANDGFKKAKGDATGTKDVIGLVRDVTVASAASGVVHLSGILTLTTAQWDAVFGTSGGLTKGTRYYLSAATAGIATATAPSTTGQFVVELGIALSTTELNVQIKTPFAL